MYYFRSGGLNVSPNEWLSVIEGLEKGLHRQTLTGFYILCRSLIVKSETMLDRFDELFRRFFKDMDKEELVVDTDKAKKALEIYAESNGLPSESSMDVLEMINETVGQGRNTAIPAPGADGSGSGGKMTIHARGDRVFRDWRGDVTIESRQFQMAFRLLRELYRKLDDHEEELDVIETVNATCRRGGVMDIVMQPPRRNRLKVMVLIDSGGSMQPYEELCSLLFQSLHKANTFSDLKIYYFHNCLEKQLYEDPSIDTDKTVKTEWVLNNISKDYRVIFVGDADMAIYELVSGYGSEADGLTWFKRFRDKYSHTIWLHPQEREENIAWMSESFAEIEKVFPMFRLSIDGLKDGMYKLMENR